MSKKNIWLLLMCLVYTGAGLFHFVRPKFYLAIMPTYLPCHLALIYLSGAAEVLLGLSVLPLKTRKPAALLIAVMLVLFLIIHVQMLIDSWPKGGFLFWIALFRLPLQFVLIRWAILVYDRYKQPFGFGTSITR